jgi:hypothetical protein
VGRSRPRDRFVDRGQAGAGSGRNADCTGSPAGLVDGTGPAGTDRSAASTGTGTDRSAASTGTDRSAASTGTDRSADASTGCTAHDHASIASADHMC